ncbi:MAG TPA: hypothetical protein VF594_03505 [Rubricoccaceae bacterium]|jgi:hypothetical protein
MNTIPTLGEIRPSTTGDPYAEPLNVPLYALRRREWRVITPDQCRVKGCPVCAWRKAGLLDTPVVREPNSGYTCVSSYCPGCDTVRCVCLPEGYEDAAREHDYALGHEHGTADGPDNRPSRRWLLDAGVDPDAYLDGYDAACAGVVLMLPDDAPARLWDELDDGLPF